MVQAPSAPTQSAVSLRGDYSRATADYSVSQDYSRYTEEDQAIWRMLFARQRPLLEKYAAPEILTGIETLGASAERIPDFDEASRTLQSLTGWRIVAVPGLIPEDHFYSHLANRRFPVSVWMRNRDELDYLQEPDLFHDFFGHVPLLTNPTFARFVQAYGAAGPKADSHRAIKMLARLYWYTVEFGLIETAEGLRAYGAGILSSKGETVHSVESPIPNRIRFDLIRAMRTNYLIDDFQKTYFVLDSFEQLFHAGYGTDFAPIYDRYGDETGYAADERLPTDVVVDRSTTTFNARSHPDRV
ncbi:MAG TPA: phenylalanine 4-monooxygenase [Steroidobacteraceae bacterium]|nr:phenylalanine 4-monooxygenase [Steroidobacteraceae bacterium]